MQLMDCATAALPRLPDVSAAQWSAGRTRRVHRAQYQQPAPIPAGGNIYRGSLDASKTLAGLSGSESIASGNAKQITLTVINPHCILRWNYCNFRVCLPSNARVVFLAMHDR